LNFPQTISFTITNQCNLRCKMCGQWSAEGYLHHQQANLKQNLTLTDWQRLTDEIATHQISSVLIRGGEPFFFPEIIELLTYIHDQGLFISIDTNGTLLKKYAADLLRIGNIHLTISVDGPEEIHDQVRGVAGSFRRIQAGLAWLTELEKNSETKISRAICFTISPYSVRGLGEMPQVARSLAINTLAIVPYYYLPEQMGKIYENELQEHFNCRAFSWQGFHHDSSGVAFQEFQEQYRKYMANLQGITNYPYMKFSETDYQKWFNNPQTPVGTIACANIENHIDIQPGGDANFCVDYPDYAIGNIKEATIAELWNSEKAERFRDHRRQVQLAVCHRCGAKYMAKNYNGEQGSELPV